MELWLLTMPLVGAGIGYATNWLAVKMLLRPRAPVRILGLTWIGLIPKRRADIAKATAEVVSSRLLTHADVSRMVTHGSMGEALGQALDQEVDRFIEHVMASLPGCVASMVPGVLVSALRLRVKQEVRAKLPEIAGRAAEMLDGEDIRTIVQKKINDLDQLELEGLVLRVARRELRTIEVLGGILGCLVGVAQMALILALGG